MGVILQGSGRKSHLPRASGHWGASGPDPIQFVERDPARRRVPHRGDPPPLPAYLLLQGMHKKDFMFVGLSEAEMGGGRGGLGVGGARVGEGGWGRGGRGGGRGGDLLRRTNSPGGPSLLCNIDRERSCCTMPTISDRNQRGRLPQCGALRSLQQRGT